LLSEICLSSDLITLLRQDAFFLQRTNGVCADDESYFLTVNGESFLLEVRFENAVGATQREANVVAKLLSFTGEFVSCDHDCFLFLKYPWTMLLILHLLTPRVKLLY
jgi:hypothetical protein